MTTQETEANTAGQAALGATGFAPLVFDVEAYLPHLADCDLTEAEERALLSALWSIMVAAVDLGFRIHPVQTALAERADANELARDSEAMLASFNAQANPSTTTSVARPNGRHAGKD